MAETDRLLVLFGFEPWGAFIEPLRERFPEIDFELPPEEQFEERLPHADIVYAWNLKPEHIVIARKLQWVQWIGAGVETAPLAALAERGIRLTNNSGVHAPNISEHILAMMLAFTRNLPKLIRNQADHVWQKGASNAISSELAGSTLLIVGTGRIGTALADKAQALGVNVIGISRSPQRHVDAGFKVYPVEEFDHVLPLADHVALCLPSTAETAGLIDARRLARMKQGGYLYNIGRGSAIVTDDLIAALQSGHLGGAGLDVTDPEPPLEESPLWDFENVMITAHSAGATPRYWERALEIFDDNLRRFQAGEPLRNQVELARGY